MFSDNAKEGPAWEARREKGAPGSFPILVLGAGLPQEACLEAEAGQQGSAFPGGSLLLEGTEEGGGSVLEAEAVRDFKMEKCCRTPPMAGEEDTPKVSALAQWAHLQAAEMV